MSEVLQPSADPAAPAADVSSCADMAPLVIYRTAKLIYPEVEYLCVVRDVSTDTLSARIYHPLPADEAPVTLELSTGERFALLLIDVVGDLARFAFADQAETAVFIDDGLSAYPKRALRVRLARPAALFIAERRHCVSLSDISQQGACIACDDRLPVGALVRLEVGSMPSVVCKVRWRREPTYGLVFEQTFRFDELARLIGQQVAGYPATITDAGLRPSTARAAPR